jgi:hypothetical protein
VRPFLLQAEYLAKNPQTQPTPSKSRINEDVASEYDLKHGEDQRACTAHQSLVQISSKEVHGIDPGR